MVKLPDSEKPIWRDAYPSRAVYAELSEDIEVDVVIIGAGIAGLTSAYLLKQSGLRVAVLEKDTIGSGTTGRTTGKVTSQHGIMYADLHNRLGNLTAQVYGQANQAAVRLVGKIVNKEKINCDWFVDDNYVFTNDPEKVKAFKQEATVATDIGLPVTFEKNIPLPIDTKAAVKFSDQGKIHTQKYLLGLAAVVQGNGSYVFENSRAIGIRDGSPGRVRTKKGAIQAKNIIVATKIPTFPLIARLGYALLEYPTESFSVACRLNEKVGGMYISPDSDHHSILPTEIDGKQVMLIVGAGGNIPGLRTNKESRYQRLAEYAEKYFEVKKITHKWSDMDYLPYDFFPLVGKVYPWSKNLYTATGFMKWGLSNGTAAAMILHDLITGKENKWASTYQSMRLRPVTSIPQAVVRHFKS